MITGCYSLDLYCDVEVLHAYDSFPATYTDELGSVCRSLARADGWKLDTRHHVAICPACVKAGHTLLSVRKALQREEAREKLSHANFASGISENIPFAVYVPNFPDEGK